jgi:hypothetical protein
MTRVYFCLFLLSLSYSAIAQRSLSKSRQTSFFTYIYPVNEETVRSLYNGRKLDEGVLRTPIDSLLTTKGLFPFLPQGNYLKVYVEKNDLHYSLIENRTAYLKLLDNRKDLQFIVVDSSGREIRDAKVSINDKEISYDVKAGLYHSKYPRKEETLVRIFYGGLANFTGISLIKMIAKRHPLSGIGCLIKVQSSLFILPWFVCFIN